jgi:hypothetical protein
MRGQPPSAPMSDGSHNAFTASYALLRKFNPSRAAGLFTSESDPSSRQRLRPAKAICELAITMHRLPLAHLATLAARMLPATVSHSVRNRR